MFRKSRLDYDLRGIDDRREMLQALKEIYEEKHEEKGVEQKDAKQG